MFTSKDIQHYADLGRLCISLVEKKKLAKDFANILKYVEKLNLIDTKDTKPMNGGVLYYNQLREDAVDLERKTEKITQTAQVVKAFPGTKEGHLKVPPIFTSLDPKTEK